ncbi:MAG: RIP metalloprotease RseP [Chlorobi bacterium]|nr:RIP metalloprotease RseP [Chlorobiota bacterium]
MEVLVKITQFLLSLSILVILHEFGHFLFARLFNTRVEKFYLFFNPWFTLFKFKRGETEYGIGWLPLGGYVKIAGMIDESMDREQMKRPPQPWEFRSKPAWKRLLIMLGGVLVNFILAIVIYASVLYVWGEEYLPTSEVKYGILVDKTGEEMGLRNGDIIYSLDQLPVENFYHIIPEIILNHRNTIQVKRNGMMINVVIPDTVYPKLIKGKVKIEPRLPFHPFLVNNFMKISPGRDSGLKKGDEIAGIDGKQFEYYDEFKDYLTSRKGETVRLSVVRNKDTLNFPVKLTENGMIGVVRDMSGLFTFKKVNYTFGQAIPAGIKKGFKTLNDYLKQLKLIFSPQMKAYESLGGFITIGSIFPGVWDWNAFWNLTAFLSIILAIMNLIPIPGLDGGHVMFLLYEVVSGRKPGEKFLEYAQIVGMIIILALLLFANGNDILRLLKK